MSSCAVPDPRSYGGGAPHAFEGLSGSRSNLQAALAERRDGEIAAALRGAPTHAAYVRVWNTICDAVHGAVPDSRGMSARVFALPLVIITGTTRPAVLAGTLDDIAAIAALFAQHGALGKTLNFGFSNALCALETLESVAPGEVYRWTQAREGTVRDLKPSPIEIGVPGEHAHLRFLVGASFGSAIEPSFTETASNIGVWGMPVTRALTPHLAQGGVEVLPLPRPPLDLLRAPHAGRCAQLEAAFTLFASRALRRFRGSVGEPTAVVSAHDDADLRVTFSSPFDAAAVDGFCWPLHPLDDLGAIVGRLAALLEECRVSDVRYAGGVLPAHTAHGAKGFPTLRDVPGPDARSAPH